MHASCNSVDRRTNMARLKVQDQKMENQIRSKAIVRSVFSLSRALFREKCGGPSLIYEYRPTEFTRHAQ